MLKSAFLKGAVMSSLLVSGATLANENTPNVDSKVGDDLIVKPLFIMGYGFGGDEVGELEYESGSSNEVSAGGGFTFGGGLDISQRDSQFGVEVHAAYKFDSATASNADVTFDRFEFVAMPYFRVNEEAKLGIGYVMHKGVEASYEFNNRDSSVELEDGTGLMVQLTFKVDENMTVSGRYTSMEYSTKPVYFFGTSYQEKVDGNNFGIYLNYYIDAKK